MNTIQNNLAATVLNKLSNYPTQASSSKTPLSDEKIQTVSRQFEGMFLSQMFGHMFKGLKTDGLMSGGNGEAIFRDFLIQEYGKAASKAGGIGLAKSIARQLSTMQEVKND
tara:strand:+ start:313 stop:645 length:333 start_codon:yes stop_codon:yes gene_type:complete